MAQKVAFPAHLSALNHSHGGDAGFTPVDDGQFGFDLLATVWETRDF